MSVGPKVGLDGKKNKVKNLDCIFKKGFTKLWQLAPFLYSMSKFYN
jgi:hypothetical protein